MLFADATVDEETLRKIVGKNVTNITPAGRIELLKRTVQFPKDITRKAAASTVNGLIRAAMATRPHLTRVGIICHQTHVRHVENIGEPFQRRIAKISYFGSGEDRGSNTWYQNCDLIIVAGTPRVPSHAIQVHLFQLGEIEAACRVPEWGEFRWRAKTEDGRETIVDGRGYPTDADWQEAHRYLVRAAIVQAIGRGRGILPDGCETIVLSTEECGIPLANNPLEPMGDAECQVFTLICSLRNTSLNIYKGSVPQYRNEVGTDETSLKSSVSTGQLTTNLGVSDRQVRKMLGRLSERGLVDKVGQRSGWVFTEAGDSLFSADRGEAAR